jgi:drug/metabolite transporter (DMT)-like permease
MASFCVSDVVAKSLTLPSVEIAWLRWVGFAIIMAPLVVATRGRVLRTGAPKAQLLRGLGMVGSAVTFIVGLHHLPMANATATAFAAPLIVTALSIPMLGERVGARRWAATGIGLVGVLIVVRPGSGSFDPASVFPLLSALAWAITIIFTRITSRTDGAMTTMTYGALVGVAALTFLVPFDWRTPTAAELGWIVLMVLASTFGQFLTILAYRRAAASLLVPFSYSQIVWSSLAGALVFGTIPDAMTWLGASIIVASGIYTAHRERVRAREGRANSAA